MTRRVKSIYSTALARANCIDSLSVNKLLQHRQGIQLRRKNMKALLALIILGTSVSFSLPYKASYVADGWYNSIRDSIYMYIFCVWKILVEGRQIVLFRRNLSLKKFFKAFCSKVFMYAKTLGILKTWSFSCQFYTVTGVFCRNFMRANLADISQLQSGIQITGISDLLHIKRAKAFEWSVV